MAHAVDQAAQRGGLQRHDFRETCGIRRIGRFLHLPREFPQAAAIEILALGQIFNDIAESQDSALQLQAALDADLLGDGRIILQLVLQDLSALRDRFPRTRRRTLAIASFECACDRGCPRPVRSVRDSPQ